MDRHSVYLGDYIVNCFDDLFLVGPHHWRIGFSDVQMHEALGNTYRWESEFEGLVDDIHPLKSVAHSNISSDTLGVRPWAIRLVHLGAMGWGPVAASDNKRKATSLSQLVQGMDQLWLDMVNPGLFTREFGLVEEFIHLFFP